MNTSIKTRRSLRRPSNACSGRVVVGRILTVSLQRHILSHLINPLIDVTDETSGSAPRYCTVTLPQLEIAHDLDPLQLNRDHAPVGLTFLGNRISSRPIWNSPCGRQHQFPPPYR
jgi:hypothetical protein